MSRVFFLVATVLLLVPLMASAGELGRDDSQAGVVAEGEQVDNLKRLTIEELAEIDVTSVSRRGETLEDTAAAVSVLRGEDLRRAGVTTLVEAMRLAAGLLVTRADGRTWAVTARGFNISTANKLLVLVDGRTVYSPLFSGVFWDVQDVLLADVERIEVIRGPGGTMWGANAVNGVINVITKRAHDTLGLRAMLATGNEERLTATVRYGAPMGADGGYRVYAKYYGRDGQKFADGADAHDPLRRGHVGFRMDFDPSASDAWSAQGDVYIGRIGLFDRDDTEVSGGNVLARWQRSFSAASALELRAYYDRVYRFVPLQFREERDTADVEAQYRHRVGRHDLVTGGGYRASADQVSGNEFFFFDPADRTIHVANVFVQDEIRLPDDVFLTVGTKIERNTYTGFELQPNVRLRWTADEASTIWGAISRAVRMPTRFDHDLRITSGSVVTLRGDPDFQSENVTAFEAGYRTLAAGRASLDTAVFYNRYTDIRSLERPLVGLTPVVIGNTLDARTYGVELSASVDFTERWRLFPSYTYFRASFERDENSRDLSNGVSEANDPRHQVLVRSSLDLLQDVEIDATLRAIGELPNPPVPAYAELDVRVGWQVNPLWELSIVGQNLLHARHPELGAPSPFREEFERSVFGRITWGF